MFRILIGSIVGGLAQFIFGFIFWGTPLASLAYTVAPDAQSAAVQTALAQNLTATGTGSYYIPWPDSAQGTILHGRGPVALIFFNTHGFPQILTSSLVSGLVISILSMLLIGLALHAIADRVTDFASRAKIVVLAGLATTIYFVLGQPTYNFYMPWGYWIYLAISLIIGFVAGGLVLARWFVPYAAPRVVVTDSTIH
ncbi:hypothetical protein [Sphingomonas abietis]|uniref:Uncharacterized protein n=1 Tax=Sphingomonas abietis TaxID=3012344 RepID=A0ABY7NP19_9SPHN|nr:hypothetical protein [Sphingomonas abietis]WBO23284.1 hypothetical protein PBT88_03865 [Sphingomonas abietis]